MNRRGSALVVVLALFALATVVAAGSTVDRVHRQRALGERTTRIAAREAALGAACLGEGQPMTAGPWTVHREGARLIASSPAGVYTIAVEGERWQPRKRR